MKDKILEIVNLIREGKGLSRLVGISEDQDLRKDLDFSSLDLAELTVRIEEEFDIDIFEDGLVNTVGEIYQKLSI